MDEQTPKPKRSRRKRERTKSTTPGASSLPPGLESGTMTVITSHSWLWDSWILENSLNLLEGRKGAGKSSICAAVAAHVTGWHGLPDVAPRRARSVLWCGAEENWSSAILPRLVTAGADPARCFRLQLTTAEGRPRRLSLPSGLDELVPLLHHADVGLLVLDPFGSLADPGIDLRVEQHARTYLEPLAEAIANTGTTAILTRHVRKGTMGDVLDLGLGSVAIGNTCRTILRCDRHPSQDDRYVLSQVAANYGRRPPSLVYGLAVAEGFTRVEWFGYSQLSAEVLAEGGGGAADRDEAQDARALLKGLLGDERRPASVVIAEARACGVGERSLRKAKAELGVRSVRQSQGTHGEGVWFWVPPDGGWPTI